MTERERLDDLSLDLAVTQWIVAYLLAAHLRSARDEKAESALLDQLLHDLPEKLPFPGVTDEERVALRERIRERGARLLSTVTFLNRAGGMFRPKP